ncbi:MAG: dTDP-4-dehydrorhamnose 3,5-epimerase [Candidatus Levybacteria bacterium]|nr:dTDP-4-dehydrorhamnose 3,5-epimerase [Candidatus Levybacteria bacterium]
MKIIKTKIKGVFIIEPEPRSDERGYFARVFAKEILKANGIKFDIAHINRSLTRVRGTIRGIHYQIKPRQEDKIIQCIEGAIFDVAVDLRRNSKTFGEWVSAELSGESMRMFFVPKGCGHAFQTLSPNCLIEYFVSEYYSPEYERGALWNDPFFKIKWPIKHPTLSDKDKNWPPYHK